MDALRIEHANAMYAPTWGRLEVNDACIEIPQGLTRLDAVELEAPQNLFADNALFDDAVATIKRRWTRSREMSPYDADASMDIPELSGYQRYALSEQEQGTVAAACETGMGKDAGAYLTSLAGGVTTLAVPEGEVAAVRIRVNGQAQHATAGAFDVAVGADATLDLTLELDTSDAVKDDAAQGNALQEPVAQNDGSQSDAALVALIGSHLRLCAGVRARVAVTVYLTGASNTIVLDDSGYLLDESAQLSVRHVVLGGGQTFMGLAADLCGDASRADIDTRYLATHSEMRDFNYLIRHHGKKTLSNMKANGVLAGSSRKVLRGTIELVHGCKASAGSEHETVLITSDDVVNKTVPTILCDEDDVAGNHGATVGHVRPDQLFYLMSRGIFAQQAEALFLHATLEEAVIAAPSASARAATVRLAQGLGIDVEEDHV